jgi:hypothetical protein
VAHVHEDLEQLRRMTMELETLGHRADDICTVIGSLGR